MSDIDLPRHFAFKSEKLGGNIMIISDVSERAKALPATTISTSYPDNKIDTEKLRTGEPSTVDNYMRQFRSQTSFSKALGVDLVKPEPAEMHPSLRGFATKLEGGNGQVILGFETTQKGAPEKWMSRFVENGYMSPAQHAQALVVFSGAKALDRTDPSQSGEHDRLPNNKQTTVPVQQR